MSVSKIWSMVTGMERERLGTQGEEFTHQYMEKTAKELDTALGYTKNGGRVEMKAPEEIAARQAHYRIVAETKRVFEGIGPAGILACHVKDQYGNGLLAEVKLFAVPEDVTVENYFYADGNPDFLRTYSEPDGVFAKKVAVGNYLLEISKGSEYSIARKIVQIEKSSETKVDIVLHRFVNLTEEGWQVGDFHHYSIYSSPLHQQENSKYVFDTVEEVAASMQAKGLTFGVLRDALEVSNQEAWENTANGEFLPLLFEESEMMELWNGSCPMQAGTVNDEAFHHWLSLLEEGNFLPAVAGSGTQDIGIADWMDSFGYVLGLYKCVRENYDVLSEEQKEKADYFITMLKPQLNTLQVWLKTNLTSGCVRTYIHAPGELTGENLWKHGKTGNSFVTNGPILTARINGKEMGETAGYPVEAEDITVQLTILSNRPLTQLVIWQNGGRREALLLPEAEEEQGCYDYSGEIRISAANAKWVFFQVTADYTVQAITNPIFLEAN